MVAEKVDTKVVCFHCGEACDEIFMLEDKPFCCIGCKSVYEILSANDLCQYYGLDKSPGINRKNELNESFSYLDDPVIRKKLIKFDSADFARVTFHIPAIHCVSCLWLLENLRKLIPGVLKAEVVFGKKELTVDFDPTTTRLSELGSILSSLGYAPVITLDSEKATPKKTDRTLVYKLSIAGFAFGNVMLFSFPEYLGLDHSDRALMRVFSFLNLALSVPVFFYSASDYFKSATKSFKQKLINIDVPIAAGLLALFLRSSYDIISATGPGYLDSFTGLVFFLLIGRWFQSKTYESLAFDRDFKSYFPLAVTKVVGDEQQATVIYQLNKGDNIRIRNLEIVPADSILLDEHAYFDYSFVTGEAKPVKVVRNELVYAGGRLFGQPVMLTVAKPTSQSHLTSLWNNDAFKKKHESQYQKIIDRAARRFTWIVMGVALITAVYWYFYNPDEMWLVLTSVLMVACPCALALAAPFTYGSMLRVFGRHGLYLKNADVIERLASIDAVVFDKTGTITTGTRPVVEFVGNISTEELTYVKALVSASTHPLSGIVGKHIAEKPFARISYFKELPGQGALAMVNGKFVQVGSAAFVKTAFDQDPSASYVFVAIDDLVKGYFTIRTKPRENIKGMLSRLGNKCVALLSGDNEGDRKNMEQLFDPSVKLLFNQDPHDKLAFISSLQNSGRKVLMVGDGLNDSGAFKQADIGLAVSDDSGVFTPASDGILAGEKVVLLDKFMSLAKASSGILWTAFSISFFYNAIALTFAVTGHLTPLVAAILMPISSVSVVGFSTLAVNSVARKKLRV
ncbi:MAG TPA: heavy metal translocating P-type ATPase metal-binding domain-containing protein [Chryseosolibacter sp.]